MNSVHPRHCRLLAVLLLFALVLPCASCKVEDKPADLAWNETVASYRNWMDMDAYRLHYIDAGKGAPVILIHGFADSTYSWHENYAALLDAGFRVLLLDLPGLGQSTVPPEAFSLSVSNLGEQIILFADALELDTFSVMGSSLGGGICLYLSLFHPDRLNRVIVVDPASFPQKKKGLLALMEMAGEPGVQFMGVWAIRRALKECYNDKSKVDDVLVMEYARPLAKPGYKQHIARLLSEYVTPEAEAMTERYDEIRVPLFIIWGEYDAWVPPAFGPRLQKMVSGSRFISIRNAGHLPHQEHPEIVNPLLVGFLNEGRQTKETSPDPAAAPDHEDGHEQAG